MLYLIIYVDDMLITSTDQNWIELKISRSKTFNVKDLGKANYYLGLNKPKTRKHYTKKGYILKLLKQYGMENCNSVATLMDRDTELDKSTIDDGKKKLY